MWFRIIYILFLTLCVLCVNGQPEVKRLSAEEYISLYKELAVVNMKEKGVPASITLAQAMFESDYGNSPLARNANNHFGIKCHNTWNGETYHQDDDARDECFRKYENPLLSFEDHSDFLKSRDRYSTLFELQASDYKGWAHGLKKAGYATNPQYATRLIDIIERYQLYLLDEGKDLPVCRTEASVKNNPEPPSEKPASKIFYTAPALDAAGTINNTPYVLSQKGDTWFSISKKKDMMLWQVLKYNDADKNDVLREGTIVYLKPKRSSSQAAIHVAKEGDTLWDIAQQYGVRLNRLYHYNNMLPGEQVKAGQQIKLK
jgi:LysM repeat protein